MNYNIITLFRAGSAFGLVVSVWLIFTVLWASGRSKERERLARRLAGDKPLNPENEKVLRLWRKEIESRPAESQASKGLNPLRSMEAQLAQAGWKLSPLTFLGEVLGAAAFLFLVAFAVSKSLVVASVAALATLAIPWYLLQRSIMRHADLFDRQFADALGLATRSLRVGQPLLTAFRIVVSELPPPVSTMFADILEQQALGVGIDEAIRSVAERSPSLDVKLFSALMVIQLRSGGNVADMMERLAEVIRDRVRLHRRAHILTAQTQFSKRILMGIPFAILLIVYVLNPKYLEPLFATSTGHILLGISALCLLAGGWMMNKIAVLKY